MSNFVYLIKYAKSTGKIQKVEIDSSADNKDDWFFLKGMWGSYKAGRDLFFDLDDAVKACEEARIKKLKSLDKQIKKLSAVVYEVQDD